MVHLDIISSENSVSKAFSDWVRIHQNKAWIGSRVAELLSENNLEQALWLYNATIWDILISSWANPDMVIFH